MRAEIPELMFSARGDFRAWLKENAEISEGVWLVFGKTKAVATLSANDALEEALCFGWIDGQMRSVDDTKYCKYFAKRRTKSVWSEKNKKIVEELRKKGMLTVLGEKAIETAIKNETWNIPNNPITDEQVEAFSKKLTGISPAYENFNNMPPSIRRTYTKRFLSFKTEKAQQQDFEKIIERLNRNLKPM